MAEKIYDVVGLGNTLMDFLVRVDDITPYGLVKGESKLVSKQEASIILERIKGLGLETSPGGSVANTIKALSILGANVAVCGVIGNDQQGRDYAEAMKGHGVFTYLGVDSELTGNCIAFITPDSERSFCFHLGAAAKFSKEHVPEEMIAKSKILHLEAYQLEEPKSREAVIHAINLAKRYNTLISIDLSDSRVVRDQKELLWSLIKNSADIVFANEEEAAEITGLDAPEAGRELIKYLEMVVIKFGKLGSKIYHAKGDVLEIKPFQASAIDTTGAGDSYAAGFLYGICNSWDLGKAGQLGSLFASKVIEQIGTGMNGINGKSLKELISQSQL